MAMNARGLAELMYERMLAANPPGEPLPAEIKEIAISYFESSFAAPLIDYLKDNAEIVPGTFKTTGGEKIEGVAKIT